MGPRIAFCQGCSDWKAGGMYRVELYARVRWACHVEGMSTREASRVFGVDRKTVRKMLSFSVPPGYRRSAPPRRPKLGPFTGIIDRILEDDRTSHRKQRHTAKRIFDRLRDEYGFTCQWRSKKGPPRRCKKGPLGGCGLVPVVHGRAPRATRRALNRLTRRRAREGPVGPRGQAWAGWSVQLAVGV